MLKGKVQRILPLPIHMGQTYFSNVHIRMTAGDERGIIGKDTIPNSIIEYFQQACDKGQDVEVIYHPNRSHRVILAMRIALAGNR